MHTHAHTHAHTHTHTHTHGHTHTRTHAHAHTRTHTRMHAHTHARTHAHTHTRTHTHTHTHTHIKLSHHLCSISVVSVCKIKKSLPQRMDSTPPQNTGRPYSGLTQSVLQKRAKHTDERRTHAQRSS